VLEDGTAIGEVPAIMRYLDEAFPEKPLLGATPKDKGLIGMWERRAELEGFAAVMEGVRNKIAGLKGRAIAGPHDYEQIPALVERSVLRVKNFFRRPERAAGAGALRRRRALFRGGHHRPGDRGLRQGARAVCAGGSHGAEALVRNRVQPSQRWRLILSPGEAMLVTPTTESPVAAVATTDPNAKSKPRLFLGLTMGLLTAAIGALYQV
jgi:hypothetical protein